MITNPLLMLSLFNTATSLAGSLIDGVGQIISGDGQQATDTNQFAALMESATTSLTKTTAQGSTAGLFAGGASLVNGESFQNSNIQNASEIITQGDELISDQTLDSLNDILSGNAGTEDVGALAETTEEPKKVDILGTTQLNDPFGINAAQANGSPIATTTNIPVQNGDAVDISALAGGDQTLAEVDVNTPAAKSAQVELETAQMPEKLINKDSLQKLAENTNDKAVKNLQEDVFAKNLETKHENKSSPSILANSEKSADKLALNNAQTSSNPNIAAHDFNTKVDNAVNNIRSKETVQETLANIDTYKVAHVSKKDNVIDVRLDPASLGKVQIKLDFTDGKTHVLVTADRPETLDILQKDSREIQKILSDNGVKADSNSLNFNLNEQGKNGQNNESNFYGKPLSFRVEQEIGTVAANTNDTNTLGYANYTSSGENGMLNIIV